MDDNKDNKYCKSVSSSLGCVLLVSPDLTVRKESEQVVRWPFPIQLVNKLV